jgi:hypothetical protein
LRFARGDIYFGRDLVGVAYNNESLAWFPKNQGFIAPTSLAQIQQHFIRREIFSGRLRREEKAFHFLVLISLATGRQIRFNVA